MVALGVFIVMLLAMPVMAETEGTSMSRDTQSPVLDGSAFTNYDTVFFHGAMVESESSGIGVDLDIDVAIGHLITFDPSAYTHVNCPYFSYDSKQGGIQPRVRYLGLQYHTSSQTEIYNISVWNGKDEVLTIDFVPPLTSTGDYSLQVIDLNKWYRFDRGLNMVLQIRNPSTKDPGRVDIAGYGARYEW